VKVKKSLKHFYLNKKKMHAIFMMFIFYDVNWVMNGIFVLCKHQRCHMNSLNLVN